MSYSVDNKLVITVASSALFDLRESDTVFREQSIAAYRSYQREPFPPEMVTFERQALRHKTIEEEPLWGISLC